MQYNQLGKSGLKVSQLSFGSWLTFGNKLDIHQARACLKYAYDNGVNFFDNAEAYASGLSESIMGQIIKLFRREDLVISTKIYWGGEGPNNTGLSRKHLFEGTKNSLQRLQLDYVDLLFCHRPDPTTPLEETVMAMNDLVRQGYALYWGTSEWSAIQIENAFQVAEKYGCIPPTMEQPEYNLFHRARMEQEYIPLFKKYGLGTTTWSPLASGILTGKYNDNFPEHSRLSLYPQWQKPNTQARIAKAKLLIPIAKELGYTVGQIAIAWCLKNPHVSSVILGASTLEQLQENLKALLVLPQLNNELIKSIEELTQIDA